MIVSTTCCSVSQRGDELGGHLLVALHDEHLGLALDDRVGLGPVVLVERVAAGLDDHPEALEPGVLRRDGELDAGRPRGQLDGLGARELAVDEQSNRRGLGDGGRDVAGDLDRLAAAGRRRRGEPLDEDLVATGEPREHRLHLDAARGRQRRLGLARARGVVPVGEQDDALLGVVREQRSREAQRGPDVGRVADGRRRDAVDLGEVRRQALHERVRPERDDPGDVLVLLGGQRLAKVGERLGLPGLPDRVRHVDDVDDGEAVHRQHELETRERAHEAGEQEPADGERRAPPALAEASPRRQVERDDDREQRRQEEQRDRDVEGDAHQALRPVGRGRPSRAATARRTRASVSRS